MTLPVTFAPLMLKPSIASPAAIVAVEPEPSMASPKPLELSQAVIYSSLSMRVVVSRNNILPKSSG